MRLLHPLPSQYLISHVLLQQLLLSVKMWTMLSQLWPSRRMLSTQLS